MWTRAELKEKAKLALKRNYWKLVLVCVILGLLGYSGAPDIELEYEVNIPTYSDGVSDFGSFMNGIPLLHNFGFMTGVSIYVIVIAVIAVVIALAVSIFVGNPIEMGARRFFVKSLNRPLR